jgi:hypothetical protein
MYAGTTLKPLKYFDAWLGAHQKLDRLAYRWLAEELLPADTLWPLRKQILRFEGIDGPDGIKRKTPGQDEPWHFYDPYDESDTHIFEHICGHYERLVKALKAQQSTRAGFEAAWLAHALVDGLTPAHHYPYEQELMRLRGGHSLETRNTPREKLLMHGDTVTEKLRNNWHMWGDKGLLATHLAFEWGVAIAMSTLRYGQVRKCIPAEIVAVSSDTYIDFFKSQAKTIADLRLYEQFYATGWTPKLARQVRRHVVPQLVRTVGLIWQSAAIEARKASA